jgi:formamidopyrimidine-DNA glycosylase
MILDLILIVLTVVISVFGLIVAGIALFDKNSKSSNPHFREYWVYEAKPEAVYRGSYCKRCGSPLLPLPPNSKGEFQCMHCQTYYNLKSGGSKCKTSVAHNATKN